MKKSLKIAIISGVVAILVISILMVIIISICKNKGNLEIYDSSIGYKTSFEFSKNKGYVVEESQNDEELFKQVIFTNEKLNFRAEICYYETTDTLYERNQGLRQSNDNYTEFKINEFNAYSYTARNELQADILLKSEQNGEPALVLYIYMERYNDEIETDMNEIFNSKDFQKILKTIKFTKIEENN